MAELKLRDSEKDDINKGINAAKEEVELQDVEVIQKFNQNKEDTYSQLTDMAEQLLDMDPDNITEDQVNNYIAC